MVFYIKWGEIMKKDKMYGFAEYVLTDDKLKRLMKAKDFKEYISLKAYGGEMDFDLADKVAIAIKKWAHKMGATHYTHWFFPLTNKYAEKQTSFLDYGPNGEYISEFNGKSLIKGETDASSFPSGGERVTFEARGYTVWDYTSPVFIKTDDVGNKVVYIPTAFCTYTGIALDEKTPLLRATDYLNIEATKLLNRLGYTDVKRVICNVGCEQEYFLIDKDKFNERKDLKFVGRTLLGADPLKNQETSYHYLGQLHPRVSAYMHDLDKELWRLGIMAKIQHNEVAPAQHEVVPVYSQVNIAADQNSLMMDIMDKVADKHGFKVIFHEKPFKGVNGSGKHNNWSLSTDTGLNLMDSGRVRQDVFMLLFTSVISAIDKHYDMLKVSTASIENDLRLGGHEAPPSIISVFVGEDMVEIMDNYLKEHKYTKKKKSVLDFKTTKLAKLYKDNCDRNRTSPFAYTGNKFEFRMVGSSQSVALPNTILATIVAEELKAINDKLDSVENTEDIVSSIIADNIANHSRIIFNGNSYDDAWKLEAKARGIVDYNNSVDCYARWIDKSNIKLFEDAKIMTEAEMRVRYDTYMTAYIENAILEAKTILDMCVVDALPSVYKHLEKLLVIADELEDIDVESGLFVNEIKDIVKKYKDIKKRLKVLETSINTALDEKDLLKKATYIKDTLIKNVEDVRCAYDEIEKIIPSELKPFPNYNDMLF